MGRIRGKNTKPELMVRSLLHGMGYRFRLHRRDLPGAPDIVLPKHRLAVFVHGCFWHAHELCSRASTPRSRTDYWGPKLARNKDRDAAHVAALHQMGWSTLVLWECEIERGTIKRTVRRAIRRSYQMSGRT